MRSRSCAAPDRSGWTDIGRTRRLGSPRANRCAFRRCPRHRRAKPDTPPIEPNIARDVQRMVIYHDDSVLVLNKPSGLPVQGGPGITRHLDACARCAALRCAGPAAPGAPAGSRHLGRAAAGTHAGHRGQARRRLPHPGRGEDLLGGRRARPPISREGRIDLPLRRIGGARGERTEVAERDDKEAARAITDYRTLDHAGQKLAWLELRPLTGRTHQLRVHCVAIGAPILGDVKYARPDQNNAFAATVDRALKRTSLACPGASATPSRRWNIDGGGGPAAPHDARRFGPWGFMRRRRRSPERR